MRSRKNSSYPHCEDVPTFRKRVVLAIDDILASHVGERVAVVCHGGVIHAVLGEILETSIDYLFSLEHSSISTIRGAGDRKTKGSSVREFFRMEEFSDVNQARKFLYGQKNQPGKSNR